MRLLSNQKNLLQHDKSFFTMKKSMKIQFISLNFESHIDNDKSEQGFLTPLCETQLKKPRRKKKNQKFSQEQIVENFETN